MIKLALTVRTENKIGINLLKNGVYAGCIELVFKFPARLPSGPLPESAELAVLAEREKNFNGGGREFKAK